MSETLHNSEDPMGATMVHFLLVTFSRVQAIPAIILAGVILLLSGVVYALWDGLLQSEAAFAVAAAVTTANFLDWLLLWVLPRWELSYGPDRPPALALAVARTLLVLLIGLLTLPGWVAVLASFAITGVVYYSTYFAPFQLGVTQETLKFPHWKADALPLRVLHISDMHVEYLSPRERKLNKLIKSLAPDVIVFSGDFVNISYTDDPKTEAHIRQVISAWSAPLGVYCVQGTYNVEPIERVYKFTEGLDNLQLLEDKWVHLDAPGGKLHILGMTTTHILKKDQAKVQDLAQQIPAEDKGFRLLVTHAPDAAPEADAAGYHLYVCGHTHGGQLRFPIIGAVFSGSALGKRFVMGRYDLDNMTLYTSRGVGLEGLSAPRARFMCPPEIILWEISGEA